VRDLEEKIKSYDETSITSSESMTDLKREVTRYKDVESSSGKYIADLENRLARADESVLALQRTVERLEEESDRRREEVEVLQTRLENLKSDGSSWRTDLEERERKVKELELKMAEWERRKKEAGEERLRLGSVVGEVAQARKSLESLGTGRDTGGISTPISGTSTPNKADLSLENQLVALQQTHTATLMDLSLVTSKYRDALHEISDLAAQIQEAKLSNLAAPSPLTPTFPAHDIQSLSRRLPAGRSRDSGETQVNGQGRRLFYRAASTDSLHSRSLSQSQSLSQELSSARSRKASTSSHGTNGSMSNSPSRSKPNLSISLSAGAISPNERSVSSLEKEIMRLQEVLHQREAEITILEGSLKEKERTPASSPLPRTAEEHLEDDIEVNSHLSPQIMNKFDEIRRGMVLPNGHAEPKEESIPDSDASLQRLNELML
jgi:predicted RNase H-like nuclease (RuvC/YqgF family)